MLALVAFTTPLTTLASRAVGLRTGPGTQAWALSAMNVGTAMLARVPAERAAMGSGPNNTARYLGSGIGIAIVTVLLTRPDAAPGAAGMLSRGNVALIAGADSISPWPSRRSPTCSSRSTPTASCRPRWRPRRGRREPEVDHHVRNLKVRRRRFGRLARIIDRSKDA